MLWVDTLKHLVHTVGWNGNSRMTNITWKYAIFQAFKLAQIQYIPGHYNKRLSYVNLHLMSYEESFPANAPTKSSINAARGIGQGTLKPSALGFELPFNKFNLKPVMPPVLQHIFQQFWSQTKPKHPSQSVENEQKLQSLAKAVFDKLDLAQPWDAVIVISALTMSRRKPLPMHEPNLRDRQWVDLTTRRKSISGDMHSHLYGNASEFCLCFIVTAMVKRYSQFQQEPHAVSGALWDKRWGLVP